MSAVEAPSRPCAPQTFDCRIAFAEELIALARDDPRIVAVCNDSVGSSNLGGFQKEFPERLINVGIAEQNMVGVAAGLANGGFIPFVCAAGPFLTGRALEQIKADIAYSGYHVVLCGMSPGMAYGELGPTHHSIEDFSWMRAISGMTVLAPADPDDTRAAIRWAAVAERPIYMRIGRTKVPAVTTPETTFRPSRNAVLRQGDDVTLIAIGGMVARALAAAEKLAARGISARVLGVSTLQPLDAESILDAARETRGLVTAEEGVTSGGLGAAVAELVAQEAPVRMRILGVTEFAPTGSPSFLYEHFGLTADGIADAALELVG